MVERATGGSGSRGRRGKRLDGRDTLAPNQRWTGGSLRSAHSGTTRSSTVVDRLTQRATGQRSLLRACPVPRPFSPPPFHHRYRPSRDDRRLLPAASSHGPRTTSDVVAAPREMHGARTVGIGSKPDAGSHGQSRTKGRSSRLFRVQMTTYRGRASDSHERCRPTRNLVDSARERPRPDEARSSPGMATTSAFAVFHRSA